MKHVIVVELNLVHMEIWSQVVLFCEPTGVEPNL